MALKTFGWDAADHLDSPRAIAAYIDAAVEDGDPGLIAAALGDIARARGMTQMAKDTGLAREALYRSLSGEGKPELTTVLKVMKALGLRLSPVPVTPRRRVSRPSRPKPSARRRSPANPRTA